MSKKSTKPAKRPASPFYKSKPPKVGSSRCDDRTAQRAIPTQDNLHATPIITTPFVLRDDGSIASASPTPSPSSRESNEVRGHSQSLTLDTPHLIFQSDSPFVRLYHGNSLDLNSCQGQSAACIFGITPGKAGLMK